MAHMKYLGWPWFMGVLLAAAWLAVAAAEPRAPRGADDEDLRRKAEDLQHRLKQEYTWLENLTTEEKELLRSTYLLEIEVGRLEEDLQALDEKIDGVKAKIRRTQGESDTLDRDLARRRALFSKRLEALYKMGELGYARFLLLSRDLGELRENLNYLKAIIQADAASLKEFERDRLKVQHFLAEFSHYDKILESLRDRKRRGKDKLSEKLRRRRELLTALREKQESVRSTIESLERRKRRLDDEINDLRAGGGKGQKAARGGFGRRRGKLPWPVVGRVLTRFGGVYDPVFRRRVFHKGMRIAAAEGTEVQAVYRGRVAFARRFKGYGKLVILEHEGGYHTLYAHSSDIRCKVGDEVEEGEVIALVGDTDSLRGPLLYFEIRHLGQPVNPLEWLTRPPGSLARRN